MRPGNRELNDLVVRLSILKLILGLDLFEAGSLWLRPGGCIVELVFVALLAQ
jgi:hypothetical protein